MKTWILVCIACVAAMTAGCGGNTAIEGEGEERAPVEVSAATVETTTLRPSLDLMGALIAAPERTVELCPQVAGFVSRVCIEEGAAVKAGDPVVLLDSRMVEANVSKAAAAVEEARANVALLQKGPLRAEIEAARQDARNAFAAAEAQRAKLKALQPLHEHGEIADVQFEMAKSAADEADAASQAAAQRLKVSEAGTRPEAIEQAKAQLQSAESELAAQKLNLELSTISSPIDGVITQLLVRQGMSLDMTSKVATVVDLSFVYARVRVPASSLAQVTEGATAKVTLDGTSGSEYKGAVARVGKVADESTGDVETLVRIDNKDGALRPGLACRVSIALPEIPNALVVPTAAVADRNGESVVTLIRDDKAYQTVVKTGAHAPGVVQIVAGISAGDTVATEGGYALPEECPVHIVKPEADKAQ
ncbi:MAG: efflux RND transporter periplasmic adaptor subunit [Candidatus Hydrogenedentes bacterium]|nr:efflux RND transporter periplasmic adaptor subunit [Candidatus Hydrogenedentota bacterium]